jgi:hypothetical protein
MMPTVHLFFEAGLGWVATSPPQLTDYLEGFLYPISTPQVGIEEIKCIVSDKPASGAVMIVFSFAGFAICKSARPQEFNESTAANCVRANVHIGREMRQKASERRAQCCIVHAPTETSW